MSEIDPILTLAKEVGNLSGVISEQSKTLREIKLDMKERITENDCKVIVDVAIDKHKEQDHRQKQSVAPAAVGLWESIPTKTKAGLLSAVVAGATFLITYFTSR